MLAIRNTKFDADEINDYISDVRKLGIKKYLKTMFSIIEEKTKSCFIVSCPWPEILKLF